MQLAGNDYRCILICMFACWKKFCYAALTAKTFANFAPFLDPKMEVEKWTQKWRQNLTPTNGVAKWHPKGGPNILLVSQKSTRNQNFILKYWVFFLGAIFGPHFGGEILAPFLGPFFNLHFGVQKWCKFCKSFCCQSCIAKLFPANKHAYQNASVVISQLIASFNTIQSSTWSNLPK